MSIRVVCEHCGAAMKIKDELAGRKGNCPKCKAEFLIPVASTLAPSSSSESGGDEAGGSSEYSIALPPSAVVQGGATGDLAGLPDFPGGENDSEPSVRSVDQERESRKGVKPSRPPADFDPDDPFAGLDDENDSPRPVQRKSAPPPPADDDFPDNPFEDEPAKPAPRARSAGKRPEPVAEEEDWEAFDDDTGGKSKSKRSLPGAKGSAATIADDFMRSFSGSGADDLGEAEAPKKKRRIFGGGDDKGLAEGDFDLSDMLMYGATRALPAIAGLILISWLVYMGSASMVADKFKYPPLGTVAGKVTLNGAPVSGATVMFQPVGENDSSVKYSASVAVTDDQGMYSLEYVANVAGAAVGRHRVEIRARNAQSQEIVPKWYNVKTALRVEVQKGSNTINFELDGKTPPAGWKL